MAVLPFGQERWGREWYEPNGTDGVIVSAQGPDAYVMWIVAAAATGIGWIQVPQFDG